MAYPRLYGLDSQGDSYPVQFPDAVTLQSGEHWERLAITTSGSVLDLMNQLLGDHPGRFRVLFILIIARGENRPGRYAMEEGLERWQLETLLADHRELFEQDGRHHIWIGTEDNRINLIYDQHDFLYAYGDAGAWRSRLLEQGFGEDLPNVPVPHQHLFHKEFDESVTRLLGGYSWHYSPLQEDDDP